VFVICCLILCGEATFLGAVKTAIREHKTDKVVKVLKKALNRASKMIHPPLPLHLQNIAYPPELCRWFACLITEAEYRLVPIPARREQVIAYMKTMFTPSCDWTADLRTCIGFAPNSGSFCRCGAPIIIDMVCVPCQQAANAGAVTTSSSAMPSRSGFQTDFSSVTSLSSTHSSSSSSWFTQQIGPTSSSSTQQIGPSSTQQIGPTSSTQIGPSPASTQQTLCEGEPRANARGW